MSESQTRKEFCKLIPDLDPVKIENLLTGEKGTGTPDVQTTAGWVELKKLDKLPARESTVVRIPHFTDEQRNWHQRRYDAGELTFLVVQVKREWFVFHSEQLIYIGTAWTGADWVNSAWAYFATKPTPNQMTRALLEGWHYYTEKKIQALYTVLTRIP